MTPIRYAYGADPAQFATLRRPDGPSRGVVVVIHGGFWRERYDASLGTPLALDLASRGWTTWNLEYRRIGNGGGVPATLDDVAAGIAALSDVGVDTSTVITLGHSAGGLLAAWAASGDRGGVRVTQVISQSGVLDLAAAAADRLGDGAVQAFCGGEPEQVPHAYRLADPMRVVPLAAPVWCVHALDDDVVPFSQSREYVARAVAAGSAAELVEVTGGHFDVIDVESAAWARVVVVLDGIG